MPETVSVVHVFIATKATKHRLTALTSHAVQSVLAGTVVLKNIPCKLAQAKGIIKPSTVEKPTVGSDPGTVKSQLQTPVEINSQRGYPPDDVQFDCLDINIAFSPH